MSSTLVDSKVLIDLWEDESEWKGWSSAMVTECTRRGQLVINPIVFAELSAGFSSYEDVDALLPESFVRREALPWEAGFLAGRAFALYRELGGPRPSPLPDFYICAHAAVAGYSLLTRDPRRCRYYFPKLRFISP